MELGIIGLPQSGKKSLYELLTGAKASESGDKIIAGVANIRDERFDRLVRMYAPKKEVPAKINIQLFPKIESDSIKEGKIFTDISKMDALCHVVRAFKDDSIYHALGSVDPIRDISMINSELVMHDLIFIEKRFERIEAAKKCRLILNRKNTFAHSAFPMRIKNLYLVIPLSLLKKCSLSLT
jgi:hypothetical protein